MKLMIVDDSNIMRRAIEKYLKDLDLSIACAAGDGETALELFDSHQPDIVTLDITMPKMDGLSCLSEIMRRRPTTRVLVISALKDPGTGLKALKLGARGFLTKPFTAEELLNEMGKICGIKPALTGVAR